MFQRIVFFCGLFIISVHVFSQGKYYKKVEEVVNWVPPANAVKDVAFSATVIIVHDAFFGDATEKHVAGKFQLGSYVLYKGQKINTANLPEAVRKEFKLNYVNLAYDIKNKAGNIVSTKTVSTVISMDMAGSPAWNKMFPGLSAEQAKDLYKTGYSIVNIRFTGVSVSMPNLDSYVTGNTGNNGSGGVKPPANENPPPASSDYTGINWEEAAYRRSGDTVFIRKQNGNIEKYIMCGNNTVINIFNNNNTGGSDELPNLPLSRNCMTPVFSAEASAYCIRFKWTACPNLGRGIMVKPDGSIVQNLDPEIKEVYIQYRKQGDVAWKTLKARGGCVIPNSALAELFVEPCTRYEFRGQAVCEDNTMSSMSGIGSVSTQCYAPGSLRAENITTTSVTIGFMIAANNINAIFLDNKCDKNGYETYIVEYSTDGMSWDSFEYVSGGLKINNLQPDTNYKVRIKRKYSNGKFSTYSGVLTFKTKK